MLSALQFRFVWATALAALGFLVFSVATLGATSTPTQATPAQGVSFVDQNPLTIEGDKGTQRTVEVFNGSPEGQTLRLRIDGSTADVLRVENASTAVGAGEIRHFHTNAREGSECSRRSATRHPQHGWDARAHPDRDWANGRGRGGVGEERLSDIAGLRGSQHGEVAFGDGLAHAGRRNQTSASWHCQRRGSSPSRLRGPGTHSPSPRSPSRASTRGRLILRRVPTAAMSRSRLRPVRAGSPPSLSSSWLGSLWLTSWRRSWWSTVRAGYCAGDSTD